jgi:hypothetical protein
MKVIYAVLFGFFALFLSQVDDLKERSKEIKEYEEFYVANYEEVKHVK